MQVTHNPIPAQSYKEMHACVKQFYYHCHSKRVRAFHRLQCLFNTLMEIKNPLYEYSLTCVLVMALI